MYKVKYFIVFVKSINLIINFLALVYKVKYFIVFVKKIETVNFLFVKFLYLLDLLVST